MQLLSILFGISVTAFVSALVTFDADVNVLNRKKRPDLYGFVPDSNSSRKKTFIQLLLLAGLHNLTRVVSVSLFFAVDKRMAWAILTLEILAFYLFKLLRKDFLTGLPNVEGCARVSFAVVLHFIEQVLVNFTGLVHLRGPSLLGGLLFALSIIYSQILPFVALNIYTASSLPNKLPLTLLNKLLSSIACMWLVVVVYFFKTINRPYWSTFVAPTTASQYCRKTFLESNDPFTKMNAVFDNHLSFTEQIKPQIVEYIRMNIETWKEDQNKHAWFSQEFQAKIPDSYLQA